MASKQTRPFAVALESALYLGGVRSLIERDNPKG